ncbi:hypothetical protein L21SP2_1139 [Salinispira pacifica]|uniref:Uncharacterized protein n=1 Tax=Salinispira pacifica TaxID=1307761 RepID=V5WFG7_9SPIO|nr:hypothetical protein L21SP2_1139 [Salinispira pacifica]
MFAAWPLHTSEDIFSKDQGHDITRTRLSFPSLYYYVKDRFLISASGLQITESEGFMRLKGAPIVPAFPPIPNR